MKSLFIITTLALFSLNGFTQTSSRYRNDIIQSAQRMTDSKQNYCERFSDQQMARQDRELKGLDRYLKWMYRGKYLNDCLNGERHKIFAGHLRLLDHRIKELTSLARGRGDRHLMSEVRNLSLGRANYIAGQRKIEGEYGKSSPSCVGNYGLDESSGMLSKSLKKIALEYWELNAEMHAEGTLP